MPVDPRFQGLFSVTVTPFELDGSLDLAGFATILEWHISQGSAGVAIAADNGEASLLTITERQAMAETAVRVAAGRVPVIMGAMGTHAFTASETIKMVEVAAAAGVSAVLVSPTPYNGTATRAEVAGRYRAVHQAVPLPIIAYNNPRHFGVAVEGDTLQQLMDEVDLVGIKESSRHFLDISKGIARFGDRISIFMGCGYLIMPGLALGAKGVLSTGVDLFGRESASIMELAGTPTTATARALHLKISRAYTCLLETGTPPAALKALLNLLGLPAGIPRLPVHPLVAADLAQLRMLFTELGVLDEASGGLRVGA